MRDRLCMARSLTPNARSLRFGFNSSTIKAKADQEKHNLSLNQNKSKQYETNTPPKLKIS